MTVSYHAVSTRVAGTATTIAHNYPTVSAGDMILCLRCLWTDVSVTASDEAGWTPTGDLFGGTGTAADAHTTRIRVDRQVATGSETGTVTFDNATPSGQLGCMISYSKTDTDWDVAFATGDDATHGANRSITASTSIALAPGDMVVMAVAFDTDVSLAGITSPAITASGITFGTTTFRGSVNGTNVGNDGSIGQWEAVVSSGSGTVAPVFSFTFATTTCGPAVFVRLREVAGANTGEASGSIAWVGSSTGIRSPKGSASGSIGWAGVAVGANRGVVNGSIAWVGTSTGVRQPKGSESGNIAWAGSATGEMPVIVSDGFASGAISWVGSATGARLPKGISSGNIGWTGVVIGGNLGVVIGSIAWVGSATGKSIHKALVSGAVTWLGSSTGLTTRRGGSSGAIAWVGSATGETPLDIFGGSANGDISWVGSALGSRLPKASAVGAINWSGIAVGADLGIAIGSISWIGTVIGQRDPQGSVIGTITWVGIVTSPVVVDPAVFLLMAHITSYKPRVIKGNEPRIVVGHKAVITKGRDGG